MAPRKWILDPSRNQEFRISHTRNAYVYRDGTEIPLPIDAGPSDTGRSSSRNANRTTSSRAPRSFLVDRTVVRQDDSQQTQGNLAADLGDMSIASSHYITATGRRPIVAASHVDRINRHLALNRDHGRGENEEPEEEEEEEEEEEPEEEEPEEEEPEEEETEEEEPEEAEEEEEQEEAQESENLDGEVVFRPSEQTTPFSNVPVTSDDPTADIDPRLLYQFGVLSKGRIRGSGPLHTEMLDAEYHSRRKPLKFFVTGRVFKLLWPEVMGRHNDGITATTDQRFESENIASHVKWFVVVRESDKYCSCLPINTYQRRGVSKPSLLKHQHAIAYASRREPPPFPDEEPGRHERPMLTGIKIKVRKKEDKLHPRARIDFGRIYTIEHNVKVYDFGAVVPECVETLVNQWMHVLQEDLQNRRSSANAGYMPALEEGE